MFASFRFTILVKSKFHALPSSAHIKLVSSCQILPLWTFRGQAIEKHFWLYIAEEGCWGGGRLLLCGALWRSLCGNLCPVIPSGFPSSATAISCCFPSLHFHLLIPWSIPWVLISLCHLYPHVFNFKSCLFFLFLENSLCQCKDYC